MKLLSKACLFAVSLSFLGGNVLTAETTPNKNSEGEIQTKKIQPLQKVRGWLYVKYTSNQYTEDPSQPISGNYKIRVFGPDRRKSRAKVININNATNTYTLKIGPTLYSGGTYTIIAENKTLTPTLSLKKMQPPTNDMIYPCSSITITDNKNFTTVLAGNSLQFPYPNIPKRIKTQCQFTYYYNL